MYRLILHTYLEVDSLLSLCRCSMWWRKFRLTTQMEGCGSKALTSATLWRAMESSLSLCLWCLTPTTTQVPAAEESLPTSLLPCRVAQDL